MPEGEAWPKIVIESGGIYGGRLLSVNQNTDHVISGK